MSGQHHSLLSIEYVGFPLCLLPTRLLMDSILISITDMAEYTSIVYVTSGVQFVFY